MKSRALFFFLVSLLVPNFAGAFLISDQGTNVREIATGDLLEFGNLTIKIYDSQSEGNLIFSQTVENAIVNGSWNLMINPDLEYGRVYWKDYEINGESVSFDGNNRLQFQSSVGSITNSSFIDFSLIDSCPEGSSIRLINSNGSVECVLIITGEIDLSNYALKNQSEIFEGNLTTTGTGFFGFLGSLASRVTKLWVGEINATGNIETSGNVSANYFIGDGSLLTGLSESGAYNDSWINQTFFNKTQILAFGYYNASNFVITDYFTKTDVLNLGYFNSTTLQNLSQLNDNLGNRGYTHLSNFTNDLGVGNYNDSWINQTFFNKTEILAFNYYNASDFDIGDYFTKLEISGFGYYNSSDFDINDYYTKSVVYNKSEVYNISEIDSIIPDLDNYFTKSEISGFAYYNDTNFPYTHLSNFSNDLEFLTEESDPIFIAENSTLWSAINSKLATSDQRYNETTLILSLNTTSNIMSLGFYNSTEIDDLIQGVGNLSFNQSLTDTLYASIVWGYNQTQPAIDYVDAQGFITDGIENNTAGWILNFTSIRSNDWSNVSLSEAQIIDFGEYIDESTANAIYLNLSGTNANQNLNIGEYNLTTTGTGFFGFLGSLASRVTKLWVGEINATGNIETSGNVSANYFIGDGSLLNNLPVGDETDPVWAADKPNYYTQTQSNATYVKKEGDTLSGNLNLSSNNITAVDCIVFASGGKICSAS